MILLGGNTAAKKTVEATSNARQFEILYLEIAHFASRLPGSGSFIRLSAAISYGQSFLHALNSKYVEAVPTTGGKETVILGSSKGAIEVEAVGLNKVRAKFARLERLRGISLDAEDVAYADPPGAIRSTCPST